MTEFSIGSNNIQLEDLSFNVDKNEFLAKKLSPGLLEGRKEKVKLNGMVLESTFVNSSILYSGEIPDNSIRLIFSKSPGRVQCYSPGKYSVNYFCMMPGSHVYKVAFAGEKYFSVTISLNTLSNHLSADKKEIFLSGCNFLADKVDEKDTRSDQVYQYFDAVFDEFHSVFDEGLLAQKESEIILLLYDFLRRVGGSFEGEKFRSENVFFKAIKVVDDNFEKDYTVPELADLVHVSVRTLQYMFNKNISMSPKSFITSLRLNAIRRTLIDKKSFQQIYVAANYYGFIHMGNFSKYYRDLFGESPKETLIKSSG